MVVSDGTGEGVAATGRAVVIVGLLAVLSGGCTSDPGATTDVDADDPPWVVDLVETVEAEGVTNPPTEIWRYSYEGEVVYYRPPYCCDIPSTLWDADGEVLCHPDGGITGDGDGQCPDFADTRSDEHLVWRDFRT